jgi:hypothetical protein
MNVITDTLRGLVRRKLWPVALLLVGALVAVPMMLAKDPEPMAVAPAPRAAKDAGLSATFVTAADDQEVTERRRVLGAKKDPFEPAPLPKAKKKTKKADSEKTADKTDEGAAKDAGTAGGGLTAPKIEPPATEPPAPKEMLPRHAIKVAFGTVDGGLSEQTVERLTVLPSEESPLLVYQGVEDGGKVAVFELTGSVVAQGDGSCEPTPEDCQILKLRAGETEFLTFSDTGEETDAQYQLELVKIYTKPTAVSSEESR